MWLAALPLERPPEGCQLIPTKAIAERAPMFQLFMLVAINAVVIFCSLQPGRQPFAVELRILHGLIRRSRPDGPNKDRLTQCFSDHYIVHQSSLAYASPLPSSIRL